MARSHIEELREAIDALDGALGRCRAAYPPDREIQRTLAAMGEHCDAIKALDGRSGREMSSEVVSGRDS